MMDLWYHDDMDGVISGSMLATALHSKAVGIPVDYGNVPTRSGPVLAVVDFQFQNHATIWVDHHPTAFKNPTDETRWKTAQHPWWLWDSAAPSCAQLLANTLKERQIFPEEFTAWETIATRVDTADYTSPLDYIELRDPAAAMAQVYSTLNAAEKLFVFRALPFSDATTILKRFEKKVDETRAHNQQAATQFEQVAEYRDGVIMADLTTVNAPWVRFTGFAMYPKAPIAVTLMSRGNSYGLSVSGNPWHTTEIPHLGRLAQAYGGGGHARAAGMTFDTYSEAMQAYWTTIRTLQT